MHNLYTNLDNINITTKKAFYTVILFSLLFSAFTPFIKAANTDSQSVQKVQTKFSQIIFLGDSLAVGYEHDEAPNQLRYGIGEHLHEQALFQGGNTNYVNYGINGLRSDSLARWLQAAKQKQYISASELQEGLKDSRVDKLVGDTTKLHQDLTTADLIVFTIGGNDFLSVLKTIDLTKEWAQWSQQEITTLKAELEAQTTSYLKHQEQILQLLLELNPNAKVMTQNQYIPLPKLVINGVARYTQIDPNLADLLVEARKGLNDQFDQLIKAFQAKQMNISYIDTVSSIEENAITLTAITSDDVHPNRVGYKRLAQQYSEQIWGEFKSVQARDANKPLSVVVNGKEVISNYPTKVINGRTYLVLRDITEAIGAQLTWDNKTQTAKITIDDRIVELTINSTSYKVNGQSFALQAEPAFTAQVNGETKTYVPVAALSEGLELFVFYQAQSKTVFVNPQ